MPAAPPVADRPTLPLTSQDYYGFLRTERYRWWKGLLGLVLLVVGWLALGVVLGGAGLAIDVARGDMALDQLSSEELARGNVPVGPAFFIANNLALAALIPLSAGLNRLLFGQRAGWLSSVRGRFRWRWLLRTLLLVGLPWLAGLTLLTFLAPGERATVRWSTGVVVLLVLVLLTTPLQAAGEEWAFRGFVPRCIAAMVPDPRAGLVAGAIVSSLLFMSLHSAQDPWLNLFYFGFGLLLTALSWRSGGLEAAVTLHAVNNLAGLVPVVLTDQLGSAFDRSAGTGDWSVLVPLALEIGIVVLVDRAARRRGLERMAAPGLAELARPAPLGSYGPPGSSYTPPGPDVAPGAPGVPPADGPGAEDSENVDRRVTLETYEHRDDPQPGADERRP